MAEDSDVLRKRGNDIFTRAQNDVDPKSQKQGCERALESYIRAYEFPRATDEQTSSAAKNASKAAWQLAKILKSSGSPECLIMFTRALDFHRHALEKGTNKDGEWRRLVDSSMHQCLTEAERTITRQVSSVPKNSAQNCLRSIVKVYLLRGEMQISNELYNEALNTFRDGNESLETLLSISEDRDIINLRSEFRKCKRKAEAYALLKEGRRNFDDMIDEGQLKSELMYEALDKLHQAIATSKEELIELESMANTYIGLVYLEVLNQRQRAKTYFETASFLYECGGVSASSSMPEWYTLLTAGLARTDIPEATDSYSASHLVTLEAARSKPVWEYVHFVTTEFPPKSRRQITVPPIEEIKSMSNRALGSFLPKLIFGYHPDKQQRGSDDAWKSICREITKQLNRTLDNTRRG